jgi:hypothetical protein
VRLISIDAETNGLHGQAFAVGVYVTGDNGRQVAQYLARCPIFGELDPWVRDNVLPALDDVAQTHDNYPEMLEHLWQFIDDQRTDAYLLAHVMWPVEAKLLLDLYATGGGPFPVIDVTGALLAHGYNPGSVDDYLAAHGITVRDDLSPHHPLYDAIAAEKCMRSLMNETLTILEELR